MEGPVKKLRASIAHICLRRRNGVLTTTPSVDDESLYFFLRRGLLIMKEHNI
jgi:hypothetical protein